MKFHLAVDGVPFCWRGTPCCVSDQCSLSAGEVLKEVGQLSAQLGSSFAVTPGIGGCPVFTELNVDGPATLPASFQGMRTERAGGARATASDSGELRIGGGV